jgi:hypothetical protein
MNCFSGCIISIICAGLIANTIADTHYVSADGSNASPYTNWNSAAHSITAAVAVADSGDTVLVTNGIYLVSSHISISKPVILRSVNGPTNTLIQGTGTSRCLYLSSSAEVNGFTITNGVVRGSTNGGGVSMSGSSKLVNCIVTGNSSENMGGGIYMSAGGTVTNCQILGNIAGQEGGGITLYQGGTVEDSLIAGNTASNAAGGVYFWNPSPPSYGTVERCIISNNVALDLIEATSTYEGSGGGAFLYFGGALLSSTIVDNISSNYGGGVIIVDHGEVSDCTISRNNGFRGGGVYLYEGGTADRCIISGNEARSTSTSAGSGGGVYMDLTGTVTDCLIDGNSGPSKGGGVFTRVSATKYNCLLLNTVISNNIANDGGGAYLSAYYGGTTVRNCLFCDNTATNLTGTLLDGSGGGGGLFAYTGGVVENCTLINNEALYQGGGIRAYGSGGRNPYVYNTIIQSNSAPSSANWSYSGTTFKYCCSAPLLSGDGNISNAPMLTAGGKLSSVSPCIDSGTNRVLVTNDLLHIPRPLDGDGNEIPAYDIGAYEFAGTTSDTDDDGSSDADEIIAGTNPADSASCFALTLGRIDPGTGIHLLEWPGVLQRRYTVKTTTNLISGTWSNLAGYVDIEGTGNTISITNPVIDTAYLKVTVELEN